MKLVSIGKNTLRNFDDNFPASREQSNKCHHKKSIECKTIIEAYQQNIDWIKQ